MAQLVRAPPCHGGGRGFESRLGRVYYIHFQRYISIKNGIIAQLGEHLPYKQGVTGSSPVGPISYCLTATTYNANHFVIMLSYCFATRHITQIASQLCCHCLTATTYADVAQLAEQLICNQQVIGSSPIIGLLSFSKFNMGGFPSGQRGQTVNLLHIASVVRIHHHPLSVLQIL